MKALKVLDEIDDEGYPKEIVYEIGSVTQSGSNVIHGKNHADYVNLQVL